MSARSLMPSIIYFWKSGAKFKVSSSEFSDGNARERFVQIRFSVRILFPFSNPFNYSS